MIKNVRILFFKRLVCLYVIDLFNTCLCSTEIRNLGFNIFNLLEYIIKEFWKKGIFFINQYFVFGFQRFSKDWSNIYRCPENYLKFPHGFEIKCFSLSHFSCSLTVAYWLSVIHFQYVGFWPWSFTHLAKKDYWRKHEEKWISFLSCHQGKYIISWPTRTKCNKTLSGCSTSKYNDKGFF